MFANENKVADGDNYLFVALYEAFAGKKICKGKKGTVHRCTGTEGVYRPYGKVQPCTV
jgi:hypothetical protein